MPRAPAGSPEKERRPSRCHRRGFPIAAFAEAWRYEDVDRERRKGKTVLVSLSLAGITSQFELRNWLKDELKLILTAGFLWAVRYCMLVTYTYASGSDNPLVEDGGKTCQNIICYVITFIGALSYITAHFSTHKTTSVCPSECVATAPVGPHSIPLSHVSS